MLKKFLPSARKIFKTIYIAPLFFGPLIFIPPMDIPTHQEFLKSYTFFLFLWSSWLILLNYVLKIYIPHKESEKRPSRRQMTFLIAGLIVCTALCVFSVQIFRTFTGGDPRFWLSLAAMALGAVEQSMFQKDKTAPVLTAMFFKTLSLSYLSFLLVKPEIFWQPAVLCLSLSSLIISCRMADILSARTSAHPIAAYISRAQPIFLFLGPIIVGISAVSGILERAYLMTIILIPFMSSIATMVKDARETSTSDPRLLLHTEAATFTQIAILFALGIIQRHFYLF